MDFTGSGIISPPERINLEPEAFRQVFVDTINSSVRKDLYADYRRYTEAFAALVTPRFTQWIGGSFTTTKRNPRDIDLLTIVDRKDYQAQERLIERHFKRKSAAYPSVDAYFLQWPATDQTQRSLFHLDLLYWTHQFGYTRRNQRGKRFARGFIQVTHNSHSYE